MKSLQAGYPTDSVIAGYATHKTKLLNKATADLENVGISSE